MARLDLPCIALLSGILAAAAPAAAPRNADAPAMFAQSGDIGPAAAAEAARAATGGRVLGVQSSTAGGGTVYRVKVLLPGGRVRTLTVDGASGRVG